MSLFNYRTRIDPINALQARIAKTEKLLKALKFWEVNDISLGDKTLRRRKVTPSLMMGVVGRGPWFDVNGLDRTAIGAGSGGVTSLVAGSGITVSAATGAVTVSHDWSKWEFGFSVAAEIVQVNAGEIQDSLLSVVTAAAANISVPNVGTTYIYVEYTYGGAATILGSTARPAMEETKYRRILHQWTVVGGVATLGKISHIGNIVIPGTFAQEA